MTSSWVTAGSAIARWRGAALQNLCYLALAGALWPGQALAQGPSGSPDGFYDQTETRSSGSLVLFNQVQEHQRELKELRGAVEELRHELKQLRSQSQKRYLDLDERLANAASASTAAPASGGDETADASNKAEAESDAEALSDTATESAGAEQAAGRADSEEAQKAYQQAFAHVQAREFDEATAAFKQFVSDYPNTRLTPNGYYWLGELYAAGDNLDAADQAFTRVIEEYADSSKVPDAMYKLGLMKARQGERERSRELLEKLRDDYPQSSAAGLAGDFLRQSQ